MTAYDWDKRSIKNALILGMDAERGNAEMFHVTNLSEAQVDWIASWLASEGFIQRRNY